MSICSAVSGAKDRAEMDERIAAAEAHAEACRVAFEQPSGPQPAEVSQKAWTSWQEAKAEIDRLYARWAELEEKSGSA